VIDVAIVGMGCRFPGGVRSPGDYWRLLTGKVDAVVEVPGDRWKLDLFYDADPEAPGRMYVRRGGFLTDSVWDFDPEFFGISPREASHMDPQQRLVLEVAWEALDDAGMAARVGGRHVGVFMGGFMGDSQVLRHVPAARSAINSHTATSGTFTMLSNRLSYVLDLRGPSMTIDTACSSSMVAIHEAAQAVARAECESALAGGVNVMLHPETTISMCKGRLLAPDGRCKSFDAAADGYGRGEGAGVLVLKPVDAARRDGDRIYAVIRATGSNQDGRTSGITVPNPFAQAALAREVCAAAEVEPHAIGYVEAHGTGTAVGDPLEMSALGQALGAVAGRSMPLAVGSAKAGIGHLEAAAGVAGVMKAALTVYHRTIAPQAWLDTLNPAIPFVELMLRVPTDVEPFPNPSAEPLVAVNGFGYGGSNAHVLMGPAPAAPELPPREPGAKVFPVSGATEEAARSFADALVPVLAAGADLDRISDAAWSRRAHHSFRAGLAYRDGDDLVAQLTQLRDGGGKNPSRVIVPAGTAPTFVFSGMGPQWWGMARGLLEADGIFSRTARAIDAAFFEISGWSIIEELLRDEATSRVTRTDVAQPANFLVQAGLVAELDALGVRPAAVVGHSVGEVTAAYASGVLSLADALLVSYHRARVQARTAGTGGMMAVGLAVENALDWIGDAADVTVAAVNGPSSLTLAGSHKALDELHSRLTRAGVFARALRVEVPYHSALMDPILPELESALAGLKPSPPSLPLYSTVTGEEATDASWDAAYWRDNVRQPVQFASAIGAMVDAGHRVFLEVGPHPVVGGNVRELLVRAGEKGTSIPTLVRKQDDQTSLLRAVGDLYGAGCLAGDRPPGAAGDTIAHVDLPAYPWQKTHLWSESEASARARFGTSGARPLLGERTDARAPEWEVELSAAALPWLPDHVVNGRVLLPGAGYLDAALSAAAELTDRECLAVEVVRFVSPLVIDEHDVPLVRLAVEESTNRFTVRSRTATGTEWTVHATGRLLDGDVESRPISIDPEPGAETVEGDELYARLAAMELRYGPAFQRIVDARVGGETVVATVDAGFRRDVGHVACPTVMDAALQCVAALVAATDSHASGAMVPSGVGTVRRFAALPPIVTVVARRRGTAELRADAVICSPEGEVILELDDIEFAPIAPRPPVRAELERLFYETEWEWRDREDPHAVVGDETAVIVDLGVQASLRARGLAGQHRRARQLALGGCESAAATDAVASSVTECLGDAAVARVLVVVLAPAGEPDAEQPPGFDAVAGLVAVARGVAQAADGSDRGDAVRGVIVTENAWRLPGDRHEPALAHAALIGARRVLRNEQPRPRWRLVDAEPECSADELWLELSDGAAADDDADEVCLRPGARMVPRIRKTFADRVQRFAESQPPADAEAAYALDVPRAGGFRELALRACDRVAPAAGEVELRMDALGLNYKDAMKVLGRLTAAEMNGTYFGTHIGMEGFGVVTRVGPGVTELAPGDAMWVIARDMFRRYVTVPTDGGFLAPAPNGARPDQCGTLVPFVTARYGLCHATRVIPGEWVLVHGAAGGTGLAAVQVARSLGARVIGSAGTEQRRAHVMAAGADAVVNSRSLNFVDDVMRITGGRGVDVVYNSLPGEVAWQNLRVAAEFGRIIEIGKAGIYGDGVMELRPFDRNLSFAAVDTDRLLNFRPRLFGQVGREVIDRLDAGEYQPLPTTTYGCSEIGDAFSAVARSDHAGRVAIELDGSAPVRPQRPSFVVHPDATYLVTGGYGAFGIATARWLASQGARHLVLVSRSGATTRAARDHAAALVEAGVEIVDARADVADRAAVASLVSRVLTTMPRLRGVFHAAGVLGDLPLAEITDESLQRVMNPKVRGALNLDAVLEAQRADLDAFVLYSSASAVVGPVPQIAYASANAVLDALAASRRAQGKPALSVRWGALGGGGMAESSEAVERYLGLLGLRPIPMDRATALLHECLHLADDLSVAVIGDIDWGRYAAACPASAMSSRFAEHIAEASSGGSGAEALRRELAQVPEEQRTEVLAYVLAEQLAEVLGISAEGMDLTEPLTDLGVDSLMTVELSARIHLTLGIELAALDLGRGIALNGIAAYVATQLAGPEPLPAHPVSATPDLVKAA
jgi:acyl transferase domain-containing protein/NADPH:quinone reductase-like Zn-dependent oxidoreductase/acyl carrier protein